MVKIIAEQRRILPLKTSCWKNGLHGASGPIPQRQAQFKFNLKVGHPKNGQQEGSGQGRGEEVKIVTNSSSGSSLTRSHDEGH